VTEEDSGKRSHFLGTCNSKVIRDIGLTVPDDKHGRQRQSMLELTRVFSNTCQLDNLDEFCLRPEGWFESVWSLRRF
jgi:hypothetical protein